MEQDIILQSDELQVIAFKLGKEEYALPITTIQEIIMPEDTTKIPRSPEFIEGVINLRGNIIPIIDGRKRFGLPAVDDTSESRIMVLELENSTVGLTVDSVSEVVHLSAKEVQPSPVSSGESNNFIKGIGKLKNRLLILIDPDKILDLNEIESIKNISKVAENIRELSESVKKA